MSIPKLVLFAGAGVLSVLLSVNVLAQEDTIEAAISQSGSSAAIRELQAQANAELPKTDDRQEIAIFYHKRGTVSRIFKDLVGGGYIELSNKQIMINKDLPPRW